MIYIDVDSAVILPLNSFPLLDDTDFKTIETGLVYNSAGLVINWNFVTSAGVMTMNVITATTGGVFDITEPVADKGMYAIEMPASGSAAGSNNDREGYGWFTGVATGILPWSSPMFCFRAASVNDAMCDGGDLLDVSMTQIDGLATSGNNATLKLKQLSIVSTDTSALILTGGGASGHGAIITAGSTTANGIKVVGGSTDGAAILATATSGDGITATGGTAGNGINATGAGAGNGILATGGNSATTAGIKGAGGAAGAHGIYAAGHTAGSGAFLTGGNGNTTGGLKLVGGATGACGLVVTPGATGIGAKINGGATSGDALSISATSGDGIDVTGGGTGAGITVAGGADNGNGIYTTGKAYGSGFVAFGDTNGSGIKGLGGTVGGHGIDVQAQGTGNGINAVGAGTGSGMLLTKGAGATDDLSLSTPSSNIPVNTTRLSGTIQTAGDLVPIIEGIGTSAGSIPMDVSADNAAGGITGVTSGTTKVGTETGTYANTSVLDGSYHVITHAANAIDWVYLLALGGGTRPVDVVWTGYLTGTNDTITVAAWNHVGGAWETIGSFTGQAGTTDVVKTFVLYSRHRGTSTAELGKVYIRFYCSGMSSPVLNTNQLYVAYAVTEQTAGYLGGAVWIDTVNGVAGTVPRINGTADNPVSTIADAVTLCTALKLKRINALPGSSITFGANMQYYTIDGSMYYLDFNGKDLSGTSIKNCEGIVGTAISTTIEFSIRDSHIGACSLGEVDVHDCALTGTVTLTAATSYFFDQCYGVNIGAGFPIIDFGSAVGAQGVIVSHWSGNLTIANMKAGDVLVINGDGDVTIAASCTAGTVYYAGNIRLTNSGSGQTIYTPAADVNLVSIDGQATDGYNATLKLKMLDIENADGNAISAKGSETTPSVGIYCQGYTGLQAQNKEGGMSFGSALFGTSSNGATFTGDGVEGGSGIVATGYHGLQAGGSVANGINVYGANDNSAISVVSFGTGTALTLFAAGSGDALSAYAYGAGSGIIGRSAAGHGVYGRSDSVGDAMHLESIEGMGFESIGLTVGIDARGYVGLQALGSAGEGIRAQGGHGTLVKAGAKFIGNPDVDQSPGLLCVGGTAGGIGAIFEGKNDWPGAKYMGHGVSAGLQCVKGSLADNDIDSDETDVLVDARPDIGQGIPPDEPTLSQALMYLYSALINRSEETDSLAKIFNASGVVACKATVSDDGTTFTKQKMVSGA